MVPALERLDCQVRVHAAREIDSALVTELDAFTTFRWYCYSKSNLDPFAGWLHDFLVSSQMTLEDLEGDDITRRDWGLIDIPQNLYWNSAQPAQLHAVLMWLHRHPKMKAVLEFGTSCGLETSVNEKGEVLANYPNPMQSSTACLFRYCSYLLADSSIRSRITLCTFEERSSQLFTYLLNCPVQTFPVPRNAVANPRLRGQSPMLTISFLGHQRIGDKGFQFVPVIVRQVLEQSKFLDRPIRFLIHNADPNGPNGVAEVQQQVRQLVVEYPTQIIVDERLADEMIWQELLDKSDLIVCPYWPERFFASYSAVACEAVANGIPLVVPVNTSLEQCTYKVWQSFKTWDASIIAYTVLYCATHFMDLAEDALLGVDKWRANHGADRTAKAIVESLN